MLPRPVVPPRPLAMPAARTRAATTHRPTGDFATHLSSARDQMIERRAARHKLATSAGSRHVAFDQDRPFSTTRDDWATAGHAKPKTIVRPPAVHTRRAVAPHVSGAPYVPDAPAMPEGTAAAPTDPDAMDISSYPRPADDNGRGLHWIPTTAQTPDAVDRFVDQAKAMHASWVVFLNDGANVGANDYLVKKLTAAGIEPVMRIYTPGVGPVSGDVGAMVSHYRQLGVDYYQILNEPNLRAENGGATPDVDKFLDNWIPTARAVAAAGGLPGLAPMAPNGDADDTQFLSDALDGLKRRGALDTLDHGWIALHNYTQGNGTGFTAFRDYDAVVRGALGRSLPVIGTEGGSTGANWQSDVSAMKYMEGRHELYFFANTLWVLANEAGGGHDPQWEKQALIRDDGSSPVVDALRNLA